MELPNFEDLKKQLMWRGTWDAAWKLAQTGTFEQVWQPLELVQPRLLNPLSQSKRSRSQLSLKERQETRSRYGCYSNYVEIVSLPLFFSAKVPLLLMPASVTLEFCLRNEVPYTGDNGDLLPVLEAIYSWQEQTLAGMGFVKMTIEEANDLYNLGRVKGGYFGRERYIEDENAFFERTGVEDWHWFELTRAIYKYELNFGWRRVEPCPNPSGGYMGYQDILDSWGTNDLCRMREHPVMLQLTRRKSILCC